MEWFENESFWKDLYPYMFPERRLLDAAGEVQKIVDLTGVSRGSVLDLCCGPGRHSVEFSLSGFLTTGVDRTGFLLDKARGHAAEKNAEVEWILSDMRDFRRPAAFDLIVNMFTAFGYFSEKSEDVKVLSLMVENLKPAGMAVIDVVGKEIIARVYQPAGRDRHDDGSVLVQHRTITDDWTRINNEWILIKDDSIKRFPFEHTLYSGQEQRDRMLQAGFSEVRLFGNLNGDSYDTKALRLVAVGTR